MKKSPKLIIWLISLNFSNFSLLVGGMNEFEPIPDLNQLPIEVGLMHDHQTPNSKLYQPFKGSQSEHSKISLNSRASFRPYKKSSTVEGFQVNPIEDGQNGFHYSPIEYGHYRSPCINPSIRNLATPTPIKLSHPDAKVWADDLLGSLGLQKDTSQLQQGLKSSDTGKIGDSSRRMQLDESKGKSIISSIETSSGKRSADQAFLTEKTGFEGRPQSNEIVIPNQNTPLFPLQTMSNKLIEQGSKRQRLMYPDEGKISTPENGYHSRTANLNFQEGILTGINDSNPMKSKLPSQIKIFRPTMQLFRKKISSQTLNLFDFQSDESNYQSSMSVISRVFELAEKVNQPKGVSREIPLSLFREALLPIEDRFVHFYASQFAQQKRNFQQIRSYCEWIGSDSKDDYKLPKGLYTMSQNWLHYPSCSLYRFGNYKIHLQEFAPMRTDFDNSDFHFQDAYDRLRWVRQVQSIYNIPRSRQKLCEAIMWGGYLLFRDKRIFPNIRRMINRYVDAWDHSDKAHELGPISPTYVANCMIDMASMIEETYRDSHNHRMILNILYENRGKDENGKVFWESLSPSIVSRLKGSWDWDKQDQAAKLLIEATNQPEAFLSKVIYWGFKPDQASFLWKLSMDMRNSQKQQQMVMDQMYEGMNLRLNTMNSIDASPGVCEIRKEIHQKQFSNKIHLLSLIADHLLSEFFDDWKILKSSEI